jgi:hypothetical protein
MDLAEPIAPAHDSIPTLVAGVDLGMHAHTPLQRFVLAHVDGRRSIGELSTATGVCASVIAAWVKRLAVERVMHLLPASARDRDSQRPTIPGDADVLAHERPTRPLRPTPVELPSSLLVPIDD